LDLLREFEEALVGRLGVGVGGAFFGVLPLFGFTGVLRVLLTGFGLGSTSDSLTAAKRDRFGEGGGRLGAATDQYRDGLENDWTHKTSTRFGLVSDAFYGIGYP
jgi:hypothetical protein